MKTLERWLPSRGVISSSVFLPKDVRWCHIVTLMSHRDVKWCHDVTSISGYWNAPRSQQHPCGLDRLDRFHTLEPLREKNKKHSVGNSLPLPVVWYIVRELRLVAFVFFIFSTTIEIFMGNYVHNFMSNYFCNYKLQIKIRLTMGSGTGFPIRCSSWLFHGGQVMWSYGICPPNVCSYLLVLGAALTV